MPILIQQTRFAGDGLRAQVVSITNLPGVARCISEGRPGMVTSESKGTYHPDVLCTELGNGDAMLLHPVTQSYYSLNQTGLFIWRLMGEGFALNEIGRILEARFDVSFERAQECVLALAGELASEELVQFRCDPGLC